jgi:hypothetical protein
VVNENNTDAFRIMNMNESGFSTVQKLSGKVRKQQIYALSSGERWSSLLLCAV